jgi:hypothetical protein
MKCWGSEGIAPRILNLGWRRVESFMLRPFYPQGKSPRYPLDTRLCGPQSRSGWWGQEKEFLPLTRNEFTVVQPVAQLLYRLSHLRFFMVLPIASRYTPRYSEIRHCPFSSCTVQFIVHESSLDLTDAKIIPSAVWTSCTEQSPAWEADSHSAGHEIPRLL